MRPQPQAQPQAQQRGWQRQQMPAPQVFRPAPQQRVERQQMPQQIYRQPERQIFHQQQQIYRQPAPQIYAPMIDRGRGRQDRGNGGGGWGRQRQEDRRAAIQNAPPMRQIPWSPGWVPPGQIRSAEVHQRNAERKAERDLERSYGEQFRNGQQYYSQPYYSQPYYQQPYYSQPYYGNQYNGYQSYGWAPVYPYASPTIIEQYYDPYSYYGGGLLSYSPIYLPNTYAYEPYSAYDLYGYNYLPDNYYGYTPLGLSWKSMLLRTLVGFLLGNNGSNYYGMQPYDTYYAYSPDVYGYGDYSQYANFYPGYYPTGNFDRSPYYSYSSYSSPYDDELINTIPIDQLMGPSYCGYSSGLLREVLAQGYEQGYYAAQYRQDAADRRRYLERIYSIDNGYYDPYSTSISENRRVFAEGYAMGYRDAMANRRDRLSSYTRNTDLFSLLMSNVVGIG
jgi:hypothetical protein